MTTLHRKQKNRYPFLPLILFIVTYGFVQLYYFSYTIFAITIAFLLFSIGIIYLWQAYKADKALALSLNQMDAMSNEELVTFLAVLFRRQGYAVKRLDHPFVQLMLKKGRKKTLVHLHEDDENWKENMNKLHELKCNEKATRAMLVTNGKFTDEVMKWAKANKINLIDRSTLEAMFDLHVHEKQQLPFIERARALLSGENNNDM